MSESERTYIISAIKRMYPGLNVHKTAIIRDIHDENTGLRSGFLAIVDGEKFTGKTIYEIAEQIEG